VDNATHIEDVSPEEMQRRMEASIGAQATSASQEHLWLLNLVAAVSGNLIARV
jgi:hypothetical protein